LQQADECVQMRGEEILAPKVSDDALLNLAAVAKRFD
jgi:hypothetical protein